MALGKDETTLENVPQLLIRVPRREMVIDQSALEGHGGSFALRVNSTTVALPSMGYRVVGPTSEALTATSETNVNVIQIFIYLFKF